ncbi:MAG: SPOR domain-containing protein [Deltaproteobacteria bacterium]|nr:SPOR domain-containing protein [Deltaproteobacteria bacterium]
MSETQAKRAGTSWIATIGGALLLMVAGFGVGLLAPAIWDASLVADHVSGKTTEVPLPEKAPVREQVADAGDSERAPAASEPATPAVSAPPPSGGFAVQVGAFATQGAAYDLAAELKQLGHPAYVADQGGNGARFKVRVGPISTRADADTLADKLKREQRLPTWVLARESS